MANIGIILAAALTPRAGAEWGRETGVKPEQYIQFKESGLAGRGGATALAAAMPSMAMRSRSVRLPQSG